jgi:hypothetical protein
MPDPDNILVAVERDDARELLLARGWTIHETNGEITGVSKGVDQYVWTLSGAMFVALADEANDIRSDRACHETLKSHLTAELKAVRERPR